MKVLLKCNFGKFLGFDRKMMKLEENIYRILMEIKIRFRTEVTFRQEMKFRTEIFWPEIKAQKS